MKSALLILALALASAFTALAADAGPVDPECKMQPAEGDNITLSPTALIAILTGVGAAGGGYMYGRKHTVAVEPQPLEVRDADQHYVTRKQHDDDMKRLYDLYYDTSNKLSELIGLVQGIRDTITKRQA